MKVAGTMIRREEVEFFLRLHGLWEGIIALPPPPDPPYDIEKRRGIGGVLDAGEAGARRVSPPAARATKLQCLTLFWTQFQLTVPHWSPDFDSQEWQPAGDSPEISRAWQAQEITLDDDRILVLDADPPAQEEFPEFFHD